MAVASVKIICKDCGKEFEWRRKCYNRKEANNSEEWAKENVNQCPDCWHKEQMEIKNQKEKESSDAFAAELEKYNLPALTGTEKQVEWATTIRNNAVGKTISQKPTEIFWEMIESHTDAKWWIDHRDEVTRSVYEFVSLLMEDTEKQKKDKEITEKISEIKKPSAPDVLAGHKWNQKIYGKSGNYSVYPDGEKVSITDEQAEEIREYLAAKEEYKKKVEEIKCQ
jgi:hypothetical protein